MKLSTIYNADCRIKMAEMEENSVTAIVTDPPYGLNFMGEGWDSGIPGIPFWKEALRVLKPGAHALIFSGTRTFHRLACAVEDAGFDIRDCLMWLYGQGYPKGLNVSKGFDREAGHIEKKPVTVKTGKNVVFLHAAVHPSEYVPPDPISEDAQKWAGYNTNLKPAWEPILLARKPFDGKLLDTIRQHGTGALNIDKCRVGEIGGSSSKLIAGEKEAKVYGTYGATVRVPLDAGRWPTNALIDTEAGELLDSETGDAVSRFFYCPKVSTRDRGPGNYHPTVKPTDLMRWLVRLVKMPENNLILDPFAGSGTTGIACLTEGVPCVLIEKDAMYFKIIEDRIRDFEEFGPR